MLAVRSLFRSSVHDRLHWSCVACTVFAFSHSSRPCICCKAQAIRVEEAALDISALSLHGHAHLITWTPRYAYGATARARRGVFTLRAGSAFFQTRLLLLLLLLAVLCFPFSRVRRCFVGWFFFWRVGFLRRVFLFTGLVV